MNQFNNTLNSDHRAHQYSTHYGNWLENVGLVLTARVGGVLLLMNLFPTQFDAQSAAPETRNHSQHK